MGDVYETSGASDPAGNGFSSLTDSLRACTLCRDRFAATVTAHRPRPVVWFQPSARVLVAGQAPGARVHASGVPFDDASGDRLRDWMGVSRAEFYDLRRVAVVPMGFCFPGYDAKGADLPPPKICAQTWRAQVMAALPHVALTVVLGGAAMRWHLGAGRVGETVATWRQFGARAQFPLPHPSWRTTAWEARNPWFGAELLPDLRAAVSGAMGD